MPPVMSPSGSRPTSPTDSFAAAAAAGPLSPSGLAKDVEAGVTSPRGAGSSLGAAAGTSAAGSGAKSRHVSSASAGALAETMEHTCPDGHASALEGHHPPAMDDGLLLEEDEEENMLEFKETASEVSTQCASRSLLPAFVTHCACACTSLVLALVPSEACTQCA
jgi:hypothetical protein